jgi:hypothetical protein
LRGKAERRTDEDSLSVLGEQICFIPDEESAATLPPLQPGDERTRWFCFDNFRTAERKLGLSVAAESPECGLRAIATITVSDYYVLGDDDGGQTDLATLVDVSERSSPVPIPCEY